MSQTDSDSQERDFEDDVSTTSTQGSEISTDSKSETKEEMDPWLPLIEEAKQRINIKNARCATGIHNKVSERSLSLQQVK
jgi:formate-dependent nitrite reductase cytochrome c552 subunit